MEATGAKAIVVVMDAADKKRFSEAAEILYDILGDIEVVSAIYSNKELLSFIIFLATCIFAGNEAPITDC